MNYLSLNEYLKNTFGCKVYKLAIDGGFTCPNRDGTLDNRGCIFCSGYGSGDFAISSKLSVTEQIELAKEKVSRKIKDGKYIAYFQSFTNTYGPINILRDKFTEAINHPDIVAISIGTRPDCLPIGVLDLLSELNNVKPVWIELGLQTIHESTSKFIRRGYNLDTYDKALSELKSRGIYVITHVILGLPGETEDMMLQTVKYVCCQDSIEKRTDGIKLQLLHIIKGTDLAELYTINNNQLEDVNLPDVSFLSNKYPQHDIDIMRNFTCMDMNTYVSLISKCISIIPKDIAIHRMTGDGDKRTLIAPLWSGDKKRVLNSINQALSE